jgi:predicted DCC family thiol-disulfide oxidoreductase YuxK
MSESPKQGTLIFDGDCGFCTSSVRWLERHHGTFHSLPWQQIPDLKSFGLNLEMVTESAIFISDIGKISIGSSAIGEAMKSCSKPISLFGRVVTSRLVEGLAQRAYKLIAKNRGRLSRLIRFFTKNRNP